MLSRKPKPQRRQDHRHYVYPSGRLVGDRRVIDCGARDVVEVCHKYRAGQAAPETTVRKLGWFRREGYHLANWFRQCAWVARCHRVKARIMQRRWKQ